MQRTNIGVAAAIVAIAGALVVGTAAANNVLRTGPPITLGTCIVTPCESTYPAGEPFHVAHGFVNDPRDILLNPQTRFELFVDGERKHSSVDLELNADEPSKLNVSNFRDGLTGVHTLVGRWYREGVLVQTGTRTVTFTP